MSARLTAAALTALAFVLTGLALVSSPAQAAVTVKSARWSGTYDVVGTIRNHDINPDAEGAEESRTHVVRSTCAGSRACPTIRVTRTSGTDKRYAYTLTRTAPGTYKGTKSYQASWWCTRGGEQVWTKTGTMTDTLTLTGVGAAARHHHEVPGHAAAPVRRLRCRGRHSCRLPGVLRGPRHR